MTINRMFLCAMLLTVSSVSFAAESNKSVRQLYDELLSLQEGVTLEDIERTVGTIYVTGVGQGNIQKILQDAERSGLNKKFQMLLTTDPRSLKPGQIGNLLPYAFLEFKNLRIIACMQKIYGAKGPFTYSNTLLKASHETSPDSLTRNPYDPVLGKYMAPGNREVTITQYGFLNGLIDSIMLFENDARFAGNKTFVDEVASMKEALLKAIYESKFYALVNKITWLSKSKGGLNPQLFAPEIIPAMEKVIGEITK